MHLKFNKISTLCGMMALLYTFQNCGPGFTTQQESTLSSGLGVNPYSSVFQCVPSEDPSATPVNHLTKREFAATYNSLFGTALNATLTQSLDYVPGDAPSNGYDNNSLPISEEHVRTYYRIALDTASHIAKDSTALKNIVGTCATTTSFNETCVKSFIENFGLKVYRRPLTSDESNRLLALFTEAGTTRKIVGLQLVIATMLQSPSFIYKLELNGTPVLERSDMLKLSSYEVASRLSFLFLGTQPDATLFEAAKAGELNTTVGVQTQAARLLKTTAAKKQFEHFYSQWLHLDEVPEVAANEVFYDGVFIKGLSAAALDTLRANLQKNAVNETKSFIDYQVWTAKGNYKQLMTSNFIFPATDDIAKIYGVNKTASANTPVESPDADRKGLLGRAAILMHDTTMTRPILRGVFIREQFLCEPIPSPDLEAVDDARMADLNLPPLTTTRTDVTVRTSGTSCAACHEAINPSGFALEGFDSLGRSRKSELIFDKDAKFVGTANVDSRVDLPINGKVYSVRTASDIADAIGTNDRGPACFARQWFRYSRGRKETSKDNCALEASAQTLLNKDKSVQDMLLETTLHPHFGLRKQAP